MKKPLPDFTIPTDPESSSLTGRNGTVHIKAVRVGGYLGVNIEGISAKRGVKVNGGLFITPETMDALARRWTQEREIGCEVNTDLLEILSLVDEQGSVISPDLAGYAAMDALSTLLQNWTDWMRDTGKTMDDLGDVLHDIDDTIAVLERVKARIQKVYLA
jgi:hypothetical protein